MDASRGSQRGLTAEELKSQIFQSMQATGVLHKLKGQLRQNMINELRGSQGKKKLQLDQSQKSDLIAATIRERRTKPWIQQALDNLVLHHIKQSHYHYTLSLFQQESGLSRYSASLTDELLSRLGMQPHDLEVNDISSSSNDSSLPHSSTPKQPESRENLTLWNLLSKLSTLSIKRDFTIDKQENMTSDELENIKPMTLSEKLRAIDDDMKTSYRRRQRDPNVTVSTLASAIKRAEEDADRRVKVAFEDWKTSELSKVRLEEAKKSKDAISSRINSLEKEYQARRTELSAREKAAVDRLTVHREQLERDMHEQRQSLLRELDQIRSREDALHQKEQFINQMENMKLREIDLLKAQQEIGHRGTQHLPEVPPVKPHHERQPSVVSTLADSLRHSQDGKQVITTKEMVEIIKEVDGKSVEIDKLKAEVAALKNAIDMKEGRDDKLLKEENLTLKEHLYKLERQLESMKIEQKTRKERLESRESDELKNEVENLKRDREEQNVRQHQLEDMILQMQRALKDSRGTVRSDAAQAPLYIPPTYPSAPSRGQSHPEYSMPEQPSYRSTRKDFLREYETLEPPVLPMTGGNSQLSTGIRLGLMKRLKELDEESESVTQQYNQYLKKNFKESLFSPKKSTLTKQKVKTETPTKPNFLSKEPDFDLLPGGKTDYTFAPDFLKEDASVGILAQSLPVIDMAVSNGSLKFKDKTSDVDQLFASQVQPDASSYKGSGVAPDAIHDSSEERLTSSSSTLSTNPPVKQEPQPPDHDSREERLSSSSSTFSISPIDEEPQPTDHDKPIENTPQNVVMEPEVVNEVSEALEVSHKSLESATSSTLDSLDLPSDPLENVDQLSADREMVQGETVGDYMEDLPTKQKLAPIQQTSGKTSFTEQDQASQEKFQSRFEPKMEELASRSSSSLLEDSLKLPIEELDVKSGASSPKSKSSLSSEEPHIDTVRKNNPQKEELGSSKQQLPPVAATRTLPSLPPVALKRANAAAPNKEDSFYSASPSADGTSWKPKSNSSASDVSEVDEEVQSGSVGSKEEDVPLFKMQKEDDLYSADEDTKSVPRHSGKKKNETEQEESLSGFSSVSIDLPSDSKSKSKSSIKKQIPELKSFDDDAISAVLKWEDNNRPALDFGDEEDESVELQHQKDEDHHSAALDTQSHDDFPEDKVDVFEQSGSQISFESEGSRKSKENESDFSW